MRQHMDSSWAQVTACDERKLHGGVAGMAVSTHARLIVDTDQDSRLSGRHGMATAAGKEPKAVFNCTRACAGAKPFLTRIDCGSWGW